MKLIDKILTDKGSVRFELLDRDAESTPVFSVEFTPDEARDIAQRLMLAAVAAQDGEVPLKFSVTFESQPAE